jgi:WD40 repeat protein
VAFSPDGRLLASRGNDGKLGLWDLSTGAGVARGFSDAEVQSIVFLPQRAPDYRIVTSEFGGTTLWDVNKLNQPVEVNQAPSDVSSVAVSPDGRLIASTGGSRAKVWRLPELKELGAYQRNIQHQCILFSPDGRWLVTAGGRSGADAANSSFIDLRDLGAGEIINSWGGHSNLVFSAAFSPDGQWLATAEDHTVKLWDVPGGHERLTINAHDFLALAVDISPDGRRLVSGGYDARAKVWDAATGRELLRLAGHTYPVNAVKFSPDGKLIATGSSDHLVKLWDAGTGREINTFVGHARNVTSVAFSPDGKRLASASQDRSIRIWEVETGVELLTLRGHTDFVNSLAFSPDGTLLISGGRDQTVRLWRAATDDEVRARK